MSPLCRLFVADMIHYIKQQQEWKDFICILNMFVGTGKQNPSQRKFHISKHYAIKISIRIYIRILKLVCRYKHKKNHTYSAWFFILFVLVCLVCVFELVFYNAVPKIKSWNTKKRQSPQKVWGRYCVFPPWIKSAYPDKTHVT